MNRASVAAIVVLVLAGCGTKAVRPTELTRIAYGGAAGERRVWKIDQVIRGQISFGGLPQLVVVKLKGTMTETVAEVLPDGGRRLEQAWTFNAPEFNGMPLGPEASGTTIEAGLLRAPSGEVAPLEGSAAESDIVLWAARTFGGFFPLLPKERVAVGEKWSRVEVAPASGGLEVQRIVNAKLNSVEGTEARISTDGSVSLVKAGPGAPIEEFRLECGGEVRFDLAGGVVVESNQDGTLRLKGRAGKTPVSARARISSVMTLKESSAR
jgi:hypothetical protein